MRLEQNVGGRLVVLDGLRGIAAIVVMLYHVGNFHGLGGAFARGYLFVDFFFLLSGFVLARSIEPRFARGLTAARFLNDRIARLWPLIALGAVAGAVSFGWRQGWGEVPLYLAGSLFLVPLLWSARVVEIYPLNPPQWSLLFELMANLVHGVLLRRLRGAAVLVLAAGFGVLLVWSNWTQGSNSRGPDIATWYFGLPRVGFSYVLGVWMGRVFETGRHRWPTAVPLAIVLPLGAMAAAEMVEGPVWLIDSVVVILAFPLTLWFGACATASRAEGILRALGALSFPLYAVHLPIVQVLAGLGRGTTVALASVAASLIAAAIVDFGIERRRTRRKRPAP